MERQRDYAALASGDGAAGMAMDAVVDPSSPGFASDSSAEATSNRLGGAGGSDFFPSTGAAGVVVALLPTVAWPDFFLAAATAALAASFASSSAAFTVFTISLIEPSIADCQHTAEEPGA